MTWAIFNPDGTEAETFGTWSAAIAALTGHDYPTGTYVAKEGQ